MKHQELVEAAKKAINAVFSDPSVDQERARESLLELKEEIDDCYEMIIDTMIQALRQQ